MRKHYLLLLWLLLAHCVTATTARAEKAWPIFKGAWFDVRYPAGWKAQRGQKSATSDESTDSARFTSPDGRAEFYVFSPQWNGTPDVYDFKRETVVARKVQTRKENTA
jgi:hypothetical protein